MKLIGSRKAIIGAGLSVGLALGIAATALAFITASTGASNVTMGGVVLTVTVGAPTGPALVPGGAGQTLSLQVQNPTSKTEQLSAITAAMATDASGNVLDTSNANAPVPGCLASWFTVTVNNAALPVPVYPVPNNGYDNSGTLNVTVSELNPAVNQNVCEGTSPEVLVTAS